MFESHQGIVASFRPELALSFTATLEPYQKKNGVYAPVTRRLIVEEGVQNIYQVQTPDDLCDHTFVAALPSDRNVIYLTRGDEERFDIHANRIFPVHDIAGAQMAVEMGIGYAAIPEVLIEKMVITGTYQILLPNWRVCDAYLVCSFDDSKIQLCELSPLLSALESFTSAPWKTLLPESNIFSFPPVNA